MPIYEYQCEKCGHEFEREQRISDPPVKTCPECRSRRVTKLISLTSFTLKGGGWYADGYADSKVSKTGKDDKGSTESTTAPDGAASKDGSKGASKDAPAKKDAGSTKPAKDGAGSKAGKSSKSAA